MQLLFFRSALNTHVHYSHIPVNLLCMKKEDSSFLMGLSEYTGLRGLWTMMYGYRLLYGLAVFSIAVAALSRTATLLLLRYFIDDLLESKKTVTGIPFFSLLFVALAILEGAALFFKGKWAALSSEGTINRLRNFLFDHIQKLSFSYHDYTDTGSLIERVTSDVEVLRNFFSERAIAIGRIGTLFLFNVGALLYLNIKLGLFSLVFIPFILFQSYWFFKKISKAYEGYQAQEAKVSSLLKENISSIRIVKAFARHDFEMDKFEKVNYEKFKRGKKLMLLHSFFWPLSDILCTVQLLFIYYLGAVMTISGQISVGTYIAAAGMVIWIIWPIRNLGEVIIHASEAYVSYGRIATIIEEDREDDEKVDKLPKNEKIRGDITFSHVYFSYNKEDPVLKDISFQCKAGGKIALLGAAGSGKTTLINLLPRFYECTSGDITVDGRSIKTFSRSELRKQIGIVEQEPFLFSRSIRDNILFGVFEKTEQKEIEKAARAAAVHNVILGFPEGYDTIVGERGVTLSGGQKQRIVIARTLLKNPRILILDDATSSVDSETEHSIRNALALLMKGRTSFIIAHRIQTIMEADTVMVLENGQIIEMGSHDDLVTNKGFYQKIFNLQSEGGVHV